MKQLIKIINVDEYNDETFEKCMILRWLNSFSDKLSNNSECACGTLQQCLVFGRLECILPRSANSIFVILSAKKDFFLRKF